jgi:hypothetical protein
VVGFTFFKQEISASKLSVSNISIETATGHKG